MKKLKHPMQPIGLEDGVARFKANTIVRFLLDWATPRGMSLNELKILNFPQEDREQFAQLIGYSVSGYGELSYVGNESYNKAAKQVSKLADKVDKLTDKKQTKSKKKK